MYGKIFASIYEGTLYGQWEALVVMQQLIVLCTPDGIVDMTPQAIAARTSIPIEIIEKGLKVLAEPDPHSRTPGDEGRRIVLMDDHRPWGWVLVNHSKYQHMRDSDVVRAQTRERVRRHREAKRAVTLGNVPKPHTDTNTNTDTDTDARTRPAAPDASHPPQPRRATPDPSARKSRAQFKSAAAEVIRFLNEKTGRNFDPYGANADFVIARLKDGETFDDCKAIIAFKVRQWRGNPRMVEYLRPKTLFARANFATYKGELPTQ